MSPMGRTSQRRSFPPSGQLARDTKPNSKGKADVKKNSTPAPKPASGKASPVLQYTGGGVVENARKANNAPGRVVPTLCKKVNDCTCPKTAKSTSCINGKCQCDNPVINLVGDKFMESIKAIGNAPITKVMGHLMQGVADVKQVLGVIAGAVLGPEAKAALKVALMAVPDTGPSHIDQATKGILTKALG
ncbi:hypothetical protein DXG01_011248 [Tephrocybe rancida]|nr:hypothetical protein DXG01_011248 [Tephrocybe rancida]